MSAPMKQQETGSARIQEISVGFHPNSILEKLTAQNRPVCSHHVASRLLRALLDMVGVPRYWNLLEQFFDAWS